MSRTAFANVQLVIVTLITIAFLWATMPGPARGETLQVPLCYSKVLPGTEHTLNPNSPKDKQVQERAKVCDYVLTVDGRQHRIDPITPITRPLPTVHFA